MKRDCPFEKYPVIFWKANGIEWLVLSPSLDGVFISLDAVNAVGMMLEYEKQSKNSAKLDI